MALRLLEAATLRDRHGGPPILLLDDPFAELDAGRSRRMLGLLLRASDQGRSGMDPGHDDASSGGGQTVIAVPRPDDLPGALTGLGRAAVRDGVITSSAQAW
jgi:hypothetical protein